MRSLYLISSLIFSIVTPIVGIKAIFSGEFKPQRTTRLIIFIITFIALLSLYFQKDTTSVFLALAAFLSSIIFLIFAISHGVGGHSKLDIVVFLIALLAIFLWKSTSNPTIALYLSITADLIGLIPTIIKIYFEPYTEDWKYYLSDVFAGGLNLLATSNLKLESIVFSLYIFLINLIFVILIVWRRRKIVYNKNTNVSPDSSGTEC